MTSKIDSIGAITEEIIDTLRDFIQNVRDDLDNNYYDKDTVNSLINSGITTTIVTQLPTTGDESKIYLVPVSGEVQSGTNKYKEYIYIKVNNVYQWEEIGSTEFSLDDYYTKTTLNTLLDGKMDADVVIPTKLSELTNDVGFIKFEVRNSLPSTADDYTVVAIPAATVYESNNNYDEYIRLNGAWEKLGYSDTVTHSYLTTNYYDNTTVYSATEVSDAIDDACDVLDAAGFMVLTVESTNNGLYDIILNGDEYTAHGADTYRFSYLVNTTVNYTFKITGSSDITGSIVMSEPRTLTIN